MIKWVEQLLYDENKKAWITVWREDLEWGVGYN